MRAASLGGGPYCARLLMMITQQLPRTDLLRLVTAGSVDDGKSTLVGRLLHDTKSVLVDQRRVRIRVTPAAAVDSSSQPTVVSPLAIQADAPEVRHNPFWPRFTTGTSRSAT
jgi:hypothetical protein